jgi:5-methylcytosine-specific restriction endonuclease McrA
MSDKSNWSWKPQTIHSKIEKKLRKRLRKFKQRQNKRFRNAFYSSPEWLEVRYQALQKCGARCQCCGASPADGALMHVDHIKPRSRFPELQLELSNLQVLCRRCNQGKSNIDATDWRYAHEPIDELSGNHWKSI